MKIKDLFKGFDLDFLWYITWITVFSLTIAGAIACTVWMVFAVGDSFLVTGARNGTF